MILRTHKSFPHLQNHSLPVSFFPRLWILFSCWRSVMYYFVPHFQCTIVLHRHSWKKTHHRRLIPNFPLLLRRRKTPLLFRFLCLFSSFWYSRTKPPKLMKKCQISSSTDYLSLPNSHHLESLPPAFIFVFRPTSFVRCRYHRRHFLLPHRRWNLLLRHRIRYLRWWRHNRLA